MDILIETKIIYGVTECHLEINVLTTSIILWFMFNEFSLNYNNCKII